jgi:hypothetical protein
MAAQRSDDTPRRYEETTEPQNPPNSMLSKDTRRAAVLSYFVPVVILFVVIGVALVYWSNRPEHSQTGDADRSEIGTAGRTDGGVPPESKPDTVREEIENRGEDLVPISRVAELRDIDARRMSGRRVSIAEADVESATGNMVWIRDDERKFPVIAPAGAPLPTAGSKVSITGHIATDSNGAVQIRADRIQMQ